MLYRRPLEIRSLLMAASALAGLAPVAVAAQEELASATIGAPAIPPLS